LDKKYSIGDLCYRPMEDQYCLITSPMDFWKMNLEKMKSDKDIKETAKCLQKGDDTELPCFDRIGVPVQIDAVLGAQGCENNEKGDVCTLCRRTARGLTITFLLNNNFYTNKIAETWEKEIFLEEIKAFNNEEMKNGIRLDHMSERSISDELNKENAQNVFIVIISYLLMFVYISISMGHFPSLMFSRVLVALGGIIIVSLSFLGSIALVSFFGIKLSLISAEVVPFLVLAIGVDNMFIITGAKDKEKKASINEQMGLAIMEVGPSITCAAFSEFLAFMAGYLANIPALQSFCLAAAFAIVIDYFLQITMFVAIVTLDEMRVRDRRYDIIPCCQTSQEVVPKSRTWFQNFISGPYYNFIMKTPVKVGICIFYIGLLVVSVIGCISLPLGLDQNTTVIQDGDLYNFFHTQPKYLDVGPPAYLIFYNIDYNNSTNLKILDDLLDNISFLSTVKPPVYSWYKDFKKFMDPDGDWRGKCNPDVYSLAKLPLELQVREYLTKKIDHECCTSFAICGETYKDDIFFNEEGLIEASRFRFQHIPLTNQTVYVESVIQTKVVAANYSSLFTMYPNKTNKFVYNGQDVEIDNAYPYSLFYVYYDQYLSIRGILLQNILIALASIFLAVQIIMNIKAALIVIFY
jgi:Niemann-Pick C1 protein